jgi:hypothetical protein
MDKWNGNRMKFFLNVPYSRKEEAKEHGCKWDATKKKWYIQMDPDIVMLLNGEDDNLDEVVRQALRRIPNMFPVVDGYWDGLNKYNKDTWNHLLDLVKEM